MNDDEAMKYEILIRRAFECERGKKGGDADIFRALFREEYNAMDKLGDRKAQNAYEKRKLSISTYLVKAIEKAISRLGKQKNKNQEIADLQELIASVQTSKNSQEFSNAISKAMDIFIAQEITWTTFK